MKKLLVAIASLLILVLFVVIGCITLNKVITKNVDVGNTIHPLVTPTATTSSTNHIVATSTKKEGADPYGITLPKGDKVGYIKKVSLVSNTTQITFQEVQIFWEASAIQAMKEDHQCAPYEESGIKTDCFIPDGYYIRHLATSTVSLKVTNKVRVTIPYSCPSVDLSGIKITFNRSMDSWDVCPRAGATSVNISDTKLYWISQDPQGRVISISEQYIP